MSDTRVFDRPRAGRAFFEGVIRDHLDVGRPEQVVLIFNRRLMPRTPGTFRTKVITRGVDPQLSCRYKSTRLWRLAEHHVEAARAREDHSAVTEVGVDETASKRGPHYVSLFVDLPRTKVIFATAGKDAEVLTTFKGDLEAHGGKAEQIKEFSLDMSKAFIAGIETDFPEAELTFDKYHLVQLHN